MGTQLSGDGLGAEILYSQCWEDVACAREALRIQPGQRVVAIGSAGDNVLGLLLDRPGGVLAVDVNPAQCALLELKLATAKALAPDDVARFLGAVPDANRLQFFERVRPALSSAARAFWDARGGFLAAGVIHVGRFERYLAFFRRWMLPVVPGVGAVRAMLSASDVTEQQQRYARQWDSARWRGLFRLFFGRRLLAAFGRHPAFFARAEVDDVGAHYLERVRLGLTTIPIQTNPYLAYMLAGEYDRPCRTPLYLQAGALARLGRLSDRVEVQNGSLVDVLRSLPSRSVDAFYLSDVFEGFDLDEYEEALEEVARVGRTGSRLCYWNNLAHRTRPQAMVGLLESHQDLAANLHRRDRAFLYSRFVVESVKGV